MFFIYSLLCGVLMLTACQDDEEVSRLSSSLNGAAVSNKAAQAFLSLMQEQEVSYARFAEILGGDTPRFELMQTGSTQEFGPFFLFPYVNDANVIDGCIIVPMDEDMSDMSSRKLMGRIGTPVNMNSTYLNKKISVFSRYLYSYNFMKWDNGGERVAPLLSLFACEINEGQVKVSEAEARVRVRTVMSGKNRTFSPYDRLGGLRIEFSLEYYRSPSKTDEVEVVALNPKTFGEIVKDAFDFYEGTTYMRFSSFDKYYRLMGIQFYITTELFYTMHPIEASMSLILERIRQKIYEKGFNITFHYTYSYPPQSVAFPQIGGGSVGGGTGGSGTGGSPTGSNPSKPKKKDEKNFVDDCSSSNVQYKESVNTLVDSMKIANTQGTGKHGITLDEYLRKVKDSKIEYSTTLDRYPGLDINSNPTIKHELKDLIEGTENKVDNLTGKYTIAEIHNHPNGTPPSFQDVLYTAKQAADTTIIDYKATFVYNAADESFYSIYVHDRDKAAGFYKEIKDQIDPETMMFRDGSSIRRLLRKKNISTNPQNLKEQLSAIFSLMDCGLSFFKVADNSTTSYDAKKSFDKNNKEEDKMNFIKCP